MTPTRSMKTSNLLIYKPQIRLGRQTLHKMSNSKVERWNYLYKEYLPSLAKARDASQKTWPVHLDHCFARIILDNAVGIDQPWTGAVKQPAVKNMSEDQFQKAIELAEKIATGEADVNVLNEESLRLRGKKRKAETVTPTTSNKKVKRRDETISKYFSTTPHVEVKDDSDGQAEHVHSPEKVVEKDTTSIAANVEKADMDVQLQRIADSKLTTFRKHALSLLCQVPPGRYSTYQAMSDFISKSSHKTCARAVGSAMRNNPFAPEVPCHRILASDGTLGGFCGHWGEEGKFANEKHRLLHEEGVRFDSGGKVKGPVFREFTRDKVVT